MSRLLVLADPETELGFQLAGVEVIRAQDLESAESQLLGLIEKGERGLVAVPPGLLEKLDDATRRRVEASYQPVVISLPTGGPVMGFPSRREYLAALIRRAIGFQITFPGGEAPAAPGAVNENGTS